MGKNYVINFLLIVILFLLGPSAIAQYCIPSFTTGCTLSDYIDDFIIEDSGGDVVLSHLGTGCSTNAYGDYTSDSSLLIELEADSDYDFEITHGTSSQYVKIWIDFDGNEDFEDSGELIYDSSTAGSTTVPTVGTFSIPDMPGVITTRMRVKTTFSTGASDSCTQTGSYGEVHDYTVVIVGENEDCFSPDNLSYSVLSSTDVEFSWDDSTDAVNGYIWHVMNRGEHPDDDTPLDSGVLPVGSEDVTVTSLTENVFYDFYIQGDCDNGEYSVWRIVPFHIAGDGIDCSNPLNVSSLPYSHSAFTGDYLNMYSGSPGSDCGVSGDYLDGFDVVYHYVADADYVLNVSLDSISNKRSAVFAYLSCDDIGVVCADEGSVAEDSRDAHGFEMLVEEGESYYFVVSSAAPTTSIDYTINIDGFGCSDVPAPTGESSPYFDPGADLSSIEVFGSRFNNGFVWYRDSALSDEVTDLSSEVLVDGSTYYVTQEIFGCESDALVVTPIEFTCDVLAPDVVTDSVELCVPGGNVILKADVSAAGSQVLWYESETDTIPMQKGGDLDVGFVNETVSYWVSEARLVGESFSGQAKVTPTTTAGTSLSNYGLQFDVTEEFILTSVDVYPTAAGVMDLELRDASGMVLETISGINIPAGDGTTPYTVTLDLTIPVGQGLRLIKTSSTPALIRDSTGSSFPYDINGVAEVTGGALNQGNDLAAYYWFYNWEIDSREILCESDKEEIVVNVSDDIPEAPEVESNYVLCGDDTFTLSDIPVEGTSLQWYDKSGNKLDFDFEVEDGVTYYVVETSGACVSQIAPVTVIVRDFSDIPTGDAEQTFVEGDTFSALDVVGVGLRWYADEDKEEELPFDTLLEDGVTYYVTQTRSGFCESDVLGITVSEVLGVEDYAFESLNIAPNPVTDHLYITNDTDISAIELYDISGRKLYANVSYLNGTDATVDMTSYSSGVYLIKITIAESTKVLQIIKQ